MRTQQQESAGGTAAGGQKGPFTETCTVYFQVLMGRAESQGQKPKEAGTPKPTSDVSKEVDAKGP